MCFVLGLSIVHFALVEPIHLNNNSVGDRRLYLWMSRLQEWTHTHGATCGHYSRADEQGV